MGDLSQAYRQYFNIVYSYMRQTFAIVNLAALTVENTSLPDTDLRTYRTAAAPKCSQYQKKLLEPSTCIEISSSHGDLYED
jgi:hypothetical protein